MIIVVNGALGNYGKRLCEKLQENKENQVVKVDIRSQDYFIYKSLKDVNFTVDLIIDFSNANSVYDIYGYCLKYRTPTIIATTGQSKDELAIINKLSKIVPVFYSANMSLGVAIFINAVKSIAKNQEIKYIDIVESHHINKKDSPSGTANLIYENIKKVKKLGRCDRIPKGGRNRDKVYFHSIRQSSVIGEHTVIFGLENEQIKITHTALSKDVFIDGVMLISNYIITKNIGVYDMNSYVGDVNEIKIY